MSKNKTKIPFIRKNSVELEKELFKLGCKPLGYNPIEPILYIRKGVDNWLYISIPYIDLKHESPYDLIDCEEDEELFLKLCKELITNN